MPCIVSSLHRAAVLKVYRSATAAAYSIPFQAPAKHITRLSLLCILAINVPQTLYTFVRRSLISFWEQRGPTNEKGVCLFRLAESRSACNCSASSSLRSPALLHRVVHSRQECGLKCTHRVHWSRHVRTTSSTTSLIRKLVDCIHISILTFEKLQCQVAVDIFALCKYQ